MMTDRSAYQEKNMKKSKKLLITAAGSLITAICLLAATVLCIFMHVPEAKPVNSSGISPIIINMGGVPISQQKLSKKYGVYTHESFEKGKNRKDDPKYYEDPSL